ncbi:MAG: FeoB-associated Cys-rich membrane protein [Paludibacteraceae bacterium]|nr:FeoB-associated Cys-rich membrane protein [Paludibacteraceae bacterium]
MQNIILFLIITLAVIYLIYRIIHTITSNGPDCGCGCENCRKNNRRCSH